MLYLYFMKNNFSKFDLFVFDLDGVIYIGKKAIADAKKTIDFLFNKNKKVIFLTNNSAHSRAMYVERLKNINNIKTTEENFMTSAYATKLYLQKKVNAKSKILVLGEEGIFEELKSLPAKVVKANGKIYEGYYFHDKNLPTFNFLVAGVNWNFNYKILRDAQWAILKGAKFIATNIDATFPAEKGILPGGGCISSAITTAVGEKPFLIGKPNPYTLKLICQQNKISSEKILMIGDRYETDIVAGIRAKVKTALVLSGITKKEELKKFPKNKQPDFVIKNLFEIINNF